MLLFVVVRRWGTRWDHIPAANRLGAFLELPDFSLTITIYHCYGWELPLTFHTSCCSFLDFRSSMATQQAVRRWIVTGAVAAVTVAGTLYGAGLKGDLEVKQVR